MKIGIIGAGEIGGNLARRLTATGHDVSIANSRGPETLADLAAETGATAVLAKDAPRDAEVVIVTIPLAKVAELPDDLLESAVVGAPVIDTNNYYPQQRDGKIEEIENGLTESRWVSNQLGRSVIKAFNGIYANNIVTHAKEKGDPARLALPIAGDDQAAKAIVADLIDQIGFDTVDAGTLDESWKQQPKSPSYGASADVEGMTKLLAEATPERPENFKA